MFYYLPYFEILLSIDVCLDQSNAYVLRLYDQRYSKRKMSTIRYTNAQRASVKGAFMSDFHILTYHKEGWKGYRIKREKFNPMNNNF